MTNEEKEYNSRLNQAYKMIERLAKNELYEDLKQEIAISLWLNPKESLDKIVVQARKKIFGDEAKHQRMRAASIYNEDGECLDDDLYFVDQSTVEQFGERKGISDDLREKGLKVAHTMNLLNQLIWRVHKTHLTNSAYAHYTNIFSGKRDFFNMRGFTNRYYHMKGKLKCNKTI